jgi:hypothetical protein
MGELMFRRATWCEPRRWLCSSGVLINYVLYGPDFPFRIGAACRSLRVHVPFGVLRSGDLMFVATGRHGADPPTSTLSHDARDRGEALIGAPLGALIRTQKYESRFYALSLSSIRGDSKNPEEWKMRRLTCPPQRGVWRGPWTSGRGSRLTMKVAT